MGCMNSTIRKRIRKEIGNTQHNLIFFEYNKTLIWILHVPSPSRTKISALTSKQNPN